MLTGNMKNTATMAALVIGCTFILPDGGNSKAYARAPELAVAQKAPLSMASAPQSSFTVTPVLENGKVVFVSEIN